MAAPRPATTRAAALPRSAIRELKAMAAGRPEAIQFNAGHPDLDTPALIAAALARAVRNRALHDEPGRLRRLAEGLPA